MSVVVGYIATPEGEAALEAASDEARLRGTTLVVVISTTAAQAASAEAERVQDELRERLIAAHVRHEIRQVSKTGNVSADLISVAEHTNADLIVIGLRRRTSFGKLLLGAKAQSVVLDAPCAVLVARVADGDER